jgi:hypothetical protein
MRDSNQDLRIEPRDGGARRILRRATRWDTETGMMPIANFKFEIFNPRLAKYLRKFSESFVSESYETRLRVRY